MAVNQSVPMSCLLTDITNSAHLIIWSSATRPHFTGGNAKFFDGSINKVKFWDRALSQEEVTQLYNEIKPHYQPVFEDAVVQYDLKGDAKDLIGGYDLTVTNATLTTNYLNQTEGCYD